jgi:transposase
MRALDSEVVDTVWTGIKDLLPVHGETHPLGCHRPRASDRDCFEMMLVRLVTGCSWEDAEVLCGRKVSDTTARSRRDEWEAAGVFERIANEAIGAYDKVIGLDLSDVAIDGSAHKAPAGGQGTGKSPTDRGKRGWKWSIATDAAGIPIGWATSGANRHDIRLLVPTVNAVSARGLVADIDTLWLDRGYDGKMTLKYLTHIGVNDAVVAKKRQRGQGKSLKKASMGLRWPVERTNSWLSNYGQLRRNTDRKTEHRLAQFALAVAFLLTAKLIDWRNRWSPGCVPIR